MNLEYIFHTSCMVILQLCTTMACLEIMFLYTMYARAHDRVCPNMVYNIFPVFDDWMYGGHTHLFASL